MLEPIPGTPGLVTVIICTYRRAEALQHLLECLLAQKYERFETIIVDGSGDDPAVRETASRLSNDHVHQIGLRLLTSSPGLTHQRNIGLRAAQGQIICFLDDDVTLEATFLAQVAALFQSVRLKEIGGASAYDPLHYGGKATGRWRLRRFLGIVPSLQPGDIDHLGRAVPMDSLHPSISYQTVGWLPGFCQVYRRSAIEGLWFDENLPTYSGEDRDFSRRVGERWRLVVCGAWHVCHHIDPEGRVPPVERMWQMGFGAGWGFAKHRANFADDLRIVWHCAAELIIDLLAWLHQPCRLSLQLAFARQRGISDGRNAYLRNREGTP